MHNVEGGLHFGLGGAIGVATDNLRARHTRDNVGTHDGIQNVGVVVQLGEVDEHPATRLCVRFRAVENRAELLVCHVGFFLDSVAGYIETSTNEHNPYVGLSELCPQTKQEIRAKLLLIFLCELPSRKNCENMQNQST